VGEEDLDEVVILKKGSRITQQVRISISVFDKGISQVGLVGSCSDGIDLFCRRMILTQALRIRSSMTRQ